jgi:hypothetical protein
MSTASTVSSTALADSATHVVAPANADLFRVAPPLLRATPIPHWQA